MLRLNARNSSMKGSTSGPWNRWILTLLLALISACGNQSDEGPDLPTETLTPANAQPTPQAPPAVDTASSSDVVVISTTRRRTGLQLYARYCEGCHNPISNRLEGKRRKNKSGMRFSRSGPWLASGFSRPTKSI